MNLITFREQLENYFNLSELRTLCFDLDIEYEKIPGETLEDKTRELISHCWRHGQISKLIEYCHHRRPHVAWPIPENPLFRTTAGLYRNKKSEFIIRSLLEWKTIHSTVQSLLFSSEAVVDAIEIFLRQPTEVNAIEIEKKWFRYCEPKAKKIRRAFASLDVINHQYIEELLYILHGEDSIVKAIQYLKVDDLQSMGRVQNVIFTLVDTSKELLIVADLHIIQIAEILASS